jgi:hypothetical protein
MLGKPMTRLDVRSKVVGELKFGIDLKIDGDANRAPTLFCKRPAVIASGSTVLLSRADYEPWVFATSPLRLARRGRTASRNG